MRSFGFRLTLSFGILWASIGTTVWALGYHGQAVETAYVMPAPASLAVPTSYVVSTSWVEPTAYAVPTYYTTAYWMDPVVLAQPTYATTAYVRRGLLGRRWLVERPVLATYSTAYVPSAYYAPRSYRPTTYALADPMVVPTTYVASADCICPPAVASAAPTYRVPSSAASPGSAAPRTGARSRNLQSEPENLSTIDSNVGPPPAGSQTTGASGAPRDTTARETMPGSLPADLTPSGLRDTSPPPPPRPAPPAARPQSSPAQGQQSTPSGANPQAGQGQQGQGQQGQGQQGQGQRGPGQGQGQPSGAGATPAPTAPADTDSIPPAIAPSGEVRRDSQRPANYGARPVRPEYRNILIGTVLSSSDREPEEGVRIDVRNSSGGSGKVATTNAFGHFAVRLADGDWAVDVTMPSGRVYEVSQIRVSNGMITDSQGRRVPSLEITR
jgi:hypothetical protein